MKVGDLVKRKGDDWIALVVEMKESNGYKYPRFMILDGEGVRGGELQSCNFEVINEVS